MQNLTKDQEFLAKVVASVATDFDPYNCALMRFGAPSFPIGEYRCYSSVLEHGIRQARQFFTGHDPDTGTLVAGIMAGWDKLTRRGVCPGLGLMADQLNDDPSHTRGVALGKACARACGFARTPAVGTFDVSDVKVPA